MCSSVYAMPDSCPGIGGGPRTYQNVSERIAERVIYQDKNRDFSILFPVPIGGNIGKASFYFTPGLGYDSLDGLNFDCDFLVERKIEGWNFSAGFGMGDNLFAVGGYASYGGIGLGYYTAFFGNEAGPDGMPNDQVVGGIQLFGRNFSVRFENDFFLKGDKFDRWRTVAVEIEVRKFLVGTSIYSNWPSRDTEPYSSTVWKANRRSYMEGEIYSSVFYVGYRHNRSVIRVGVNHPIVQDIIQNGWHTMVDKPYFHTPYGQYFSVYLYLGYYNPFSLFAK